VPCRDHTSKALRYGTRSQGISQFYLHTTRTSANGMNLPLPSQLKLVLIYRPGRDGRLRWPWVAGWLHTEVSVRHWELNPDWEHKCVLNWCIWVTGHVRKSTQQQCMKKCMKTMSTTLTTVNIAPLLITP